MIPKVAQFYGLATPLVRGNIKTREAAMVDMVDLYGLNVFTFTYADAPGSVRNLYPHLKREGTY